ncbi:NAD(P)H-hydrate dehydratase [Rhodobacteraceae bacterium B1Z28]|uniref:Bifunctional NAD(P)H-hydrate repair enzyme n=1 Tax=Ruegeria haliotis TaxID=2747601 RepID=A0ABX2PPP4_9RHOB|nr:NAD(P)H-hydrate dehydratase [Ruegeria haliotis]NVO55651.1 NAD(P)H-hydrate dehydratase [Ruegeria haliotis]
MTELLTAAQMRAIEQAAIESGQVTGLELMERAGQGVVEAIFEEWPELSKTSGRAVVLCGPGNNGGDGFVVARLLKEWGWEVQVYLYGDPDKLPPDARANCERWRKIGAIEGSNPVVDELRQGKFDIVVDAVFGTELSRPLSGDAKAFCLEMFKVGIDVAIDVPSGFCSDSGKFLDEETSFYDGPEGVELIVTFERKRLGHELGLLADQAGTLRVKEIGISDFVPSFRRDYSIQYETGNFRWHAAGKYASDLRTNKPTHKYSHGHALVLSGGSGKTGAARLAARGALRIGAGLVTLGVPPAAQMEVASHVTAIMLQRVEDASALTEVLKDERLNALCLGPGLGAQRAYDLVPVALAVGRKTVLDADALSAFANDPAALFDLLHENCVLTPHGGEFMRLFPDIAEKLAAVPIKGPAYSKVDATREAAKRAGCTVLFKGPDTVIAAPDGRCSINSAHYERAAPWLATAGSGDVLAGFITGLLARGFAPMQAAETAAWLHVECARSFGPGLIAEDLPEQLPDVFKQLNI